MLKYTILSNDQNLTFCLDDANFYLVAKQILIDIKNGKILFKN